MGRNKFLQSEVNAIRRLLALKNKANRFGQKQIRHELRTEYDLISPTLMSQVRLLVQRN